MYYQDPDRNFVELQIGRFPEPDQATAYMHGAEYAADSVGPAFDPEELLAAHRAGASIAELSDRSWALKAELPNPLDVLMGGGMISLEIAARHPRWPLVGVATSGNGARIPAGGAAEALGSLPLSGVVDLPVAERDAVMFGPAGSFTQAARNAAHDSYAPTPFIELVLSFASPAWRCVVRLPPSDDIAVQYSRQHASIRFITYVLPTPVTTTERQRCGYQGLSDIGVPSRDSGRGEWPTSRSDRRGKYYLERQVWPESQLCCEGPGSGDRRRSRHIRRRYFLWHR
jgi:hypothetical protein